MGHFLAATSMWGGQTGKGYFIAGKIARWSAVYFAFHIGKRILQ
jgi:hypothetical protein